jgi:hypothetical protein
MPVTAAFRGWKAQDVIKWFHGIGRLVQLRVHGPFGAPDRPVRDET